MSQLKHRHLITLTLQVDFAGMLSIGQTPVGLRRVVPITEGRFTGERLSGKVLPGGNDWAVGRADGVLVIDVRLTLKTDHGALIYLAYQGRFLAAPEAMVRFSRGEVLQPEEYSLAISARFECGDPRYAWLNNVIAVGTGEQNVDGPVYSIYEIG